MGVLPESKVRVVVAMVLRLLWASPSLTANSIIRSVVLGVAAVLL